MIQYVDPFLFVKTIANININLSFTHLFLILAVIIFQFQFILCNFAAYMI